MRCLPLQAPRRAPAILLAAALLLSAGCSARPMLSPLQQADLAFAAGDLAAAARGYEEVLAAGSAAGEEEQLLFRLGMLYSTAGSPVVDPRRGRQLLARLVAHHPDSPYRDQAAYVLALEDRILALDLEVTRARDRTGELEERLENLQTEREQEHGERTAELTRRQTAITDLQRRLAELERQLEELKRIDLGEAPPRP